MPKICYESKRFKDSSLQKIALANRAIAAYAAGGYNAPTLRQLYYNLVKGNYIPNNDKEYDKLGALLTDARMAGLVDWNGIQDLTRDLKGLAHWDSPSQVIDTYADYFTINRWENMDIRPEIWVEKDALSNIFSRVANELDVPYFSCRGYGSASGLWRAGRRMKEHLEAGKTPIIFHFGDHDPSGIDMTRDIRERVSLFAETEIEVIRVAMNMDQIEEFDLPPQPAKVTDSRAKDYIDQFGDSSWELDAFDPATLSNMVRDAIIPYRDEDEWERTGDVQQGGRDELRMVADNYPKAVKAVKKK
jgi:hypothetical protein